MINAIALGETIDFSLPDDKENPTVWLIGPLDSITKTKLFSKLMPTTVEAETGKVSSSSIDALNFNINIVKFGLKGFKNFKTKSGKEIQFKTEKLNIFNSEYDVISEEILKVIPMDALNSLAAKILEENSVSEGEQKN